MLLNEVVLLLLLLEIIMFKLTIARLVILFYDTIFFSFTTFKLSYSLYEWCIIVVVI